MEAVPAFSLSFILQILRKRAKIYKRYVWALMNIP